MPILVAQLTLIFIQSFQKMVNGHAANFNARNVPYAIKRISFKRVPVWLVYDFSVFIEFKSMDV